MRVAVVEPFPRTSGVTTYAKHLSAGLRDAGCSVDLVSFVGDRARKLTVGGQAAVEGGRVKSGWQWSPLSPDRVVKWGDAARALGEYDLIVLNEPRCAPADKAAMRRLGSGDIKAGRSAAEQHELAYDDLPQYVKALAESGRPWATCMHDPGYSRKHAPFLAQLLELAPPSLVMHHRDGALESAAWAQEESCSTWGASLMRRHLPYSSEGPLRPNEGVQSVGVTGRYINNKGQPTVVGLAAYGMLPEGWRVEVAGASPLGAGPNHTFLTFEALLKLGFEGAREGNGNVTTGDPWEAWTPVMTATGGKTVAEYVGPYDSGVEASRQHAIHVNATEEAFGGAGSLEYADLEALEAGCLLVLPRHRDVDRDFAGLAEHYDLAKCLNAELSPVTPERMATLRSLSRAVADQARAWADPVIRRARSSGEQAKLAELFSARSYAEALLGALPG